MDAEAAKNTSITLNNDAEKMKKKIPLLSDWIDRLASLIKLIRDNFEMANSTLAEVKKPFPKFDELTAMLGRCLFIPSRVSAMICLVLLHVIKNDSGLHQ